MIINVDGQLHTSDTAKISVLDRGFLFGDSIYEVTDAQDSHPLFIEEHLDRLWQSAKKIDMILPYTREFIKDQLGKTLERLNVKRAYIRIIVTRGVGDISLSPQSSNTFSFVIITKELQANPSWWYDKGVEVIIAKTKRTAKDSIDPSIKSGNYLNNVMAHNEAVKQGVFDAIMLNHEGQITEGTTSNIWMVKNDHFITPPIKDGILEGITRKMLLKLLSQKKLKYSESTISESDILTADEVFLTSSTRRILPVVKINNTLIGAAVPGPKTRQLIELYEDFLKSRD